MELLIIIKLSDSCLTAWRIRVGATFLTALIYLGIHLFR
jgi:hypothetical protein